MISQPVKVSIWLEYVSFHVLVIAGLSRKTIRTHRNKSMVRILSYNLLQAPSAKNE